jgi:rhodanese-related sulfurtransferase
MKKIILGILAAVCLTGCTSKKATVEAMSPMEAAGMQRNGFATVVDVREEDEVRYSGMVPGAKWIPTSRIQADAPEWRALLASANKEQKLVFYCAGGGRAQDAAEKAVAAGIPSANMGGFTAWKNAGLPVSKELPGAAPTQK